MKHILFILDKQAHGKFYEKKNNLIAKFVAFF